MSFEPIGIYRDEGTTRVLLNTLSWSKNGLSQMPRDSHNNNIENLLINWLKITYFHQPEKLMIFRNFIKRDTNVKIKIK